MTRPDDYLWDRGGTADPDVAHLEELLAPLAHDPRAVPLAVLPYRARPRWAVAAAGGAVLAAVAALALLALWPRRAAHRAPPVACAGADGFAFTAQDGGTVACSGAALAAGVLPVGGVLDTGAHRAELAIADIGRAELGAQTRIRLDRTGPERHQLFLERGRMHARVLAPPRIFAVATPGAHVTDLGCEYTIDIDETGAGSIVVLTGKVELEGGSGAVVVVPQGARANLLAGRRAGLPVLAPPGAALAAAVRAFEAGEPGGVDAVLAAATEEDAITVAALAALAPAAQRRTILERLDRIFRVPAPHTLEQALADPAVLAAWFEQVTFFAMARGSLPWNTPPTTTP